MERFAAMITREFTVPELLAQVRRLSGQPADRGDDEPRAHDVSPLDLAEEPAALPDAGRLRALPRLLVPHGRSLAAAALQGDAGHHRGDEGVAQPEPDLRPVVLHRRVLPAHRDVGLAGRAGVLPRHAARGAVRPLPRLVAQVQGVRVPGVRAAAADPDPRLGAARDRDVHRHRIGDGVPRVPRLVLRHRSQHDARRASRSTSRTSAPHPVSARASGRCSGT